MHKLLVLPGNCTTLGGHTVSLSLMMRGFELCQLSEQVCVLVQSDTLLAEYLTQANQGFCLQAIAAASWPQFIRRALHWIAKQPQDWPLLLENFTARQALLAIAPAIPALRLSSRPIYHMFRDRALSYNCLGNWSRQLIFKSLAPRLLCNSYYTAQSIRERWGPVEAVLYPPVDPLRFDACPSKGSPPKALQPILEAGRRVMLSVSRISKPNQVNDKNLRSLISVLAQLKAADYNYHGVIVGQDTSVGRKYSRALLEQAKSLGVADRFTILPPSFSIQDYYKFADVVVTLAPREPFGRTVVEAIACGVPVIGSRTGGVGEILSSFAPEWTVDPYDPVAAAEAVVHVAANSNTLYLLTLGQRWVERQCSAINYACYLAKIVGILKR